MDRIREVRHLGMPRAVYPQPLRVLDRLLSQTAAAPNGCVTWTGGVDRDNYGKTMVDGKTVRVHRAVYQLFFGRMDSSLCVDHVCHNEDTTCQGGRGCLHRRCINPHHLEAVTNAENLRRSLNANARKTHCAKGHPFDGVNSYSTGARRICRACARIAVEAHRERKRAAAPAVTA